MRRVVSLPRHARAWVDLAPSARDLPRDLDGASSRLPSHGPCGASDWEALLGLMVVRGPEHSAEIAVRNISGGSEEVEVIVPDSAIKEGLGDRFVGSPSPTPRDFGKALVSGFAERVQQAAGVPGGRLVLVHAAPGPGSCTPWLMSGLGWMLADLWVHQEPSDLRHWMRAAYATAFETWGR